MGINRRDFLSIVGAGSAIGATAGLLGCNNQKSPTSPRDPELNPPPKPDPPIVVAGNTPGNGLRPGFGDIERHYYRRSL